MIFMRFIGEGNVIMRHTVLFYNPISTSKGKQRLPLSLMAVAAVIQDDYDLEFIDGNLIDEPADYIIERPKATKGIFRSSRKVMRGSL